MSFFVKGEIYFYFKVGTKEITSTPREGVIIEWPLNGQFHDAPEVILTSRTYVREMVDDDDYDEWPLVIYGRFSCRCRVDLS